MWKNVLIFSLYFNNNEFILIFFTETPTSIYGNSLRQQVEDRLKFYESGEAPRKNVDVMEEAMALADTENPAETSMKKKKKKEKKRKSEAADETFGNENGNNGNGNNTLNTTNGDAEENGNGTLNGEPKKKKKKKNKNKVNGD